MSSKEQTMEQYYETLKKFAAQKGLIFNPDQGVVLPLVEGLFTNKTRYGHPSCPCRLACGDFDKDRDIICPCEYAPLDIEEYGKCYCGLYVSEAYAQGEIQDQKVPERRPTDKICF